MTLRPFRRLASALLLGVFLAPLRAVPQVQGGTEPGADFQWWGSVAWDPSLGSAGTPAKMRAGHIDGDQRLDVFVRGALAPAGSPGSHELLFLSAPWIAGGTARAVQTVNDFEFQPGPATNPVGKLAFVNAAGLSLLQWSEANTPPFEEVLVASGPAWAGAKLVRHADLDGDSTPDYAGLAVDKRSVVLRAVSATGYHTVAFNMGIDVTDIAPLQWTAGGAQEIAILTPAGIQIRDAAGLVLATFALPSPRASHLAIVHTGTSGPDRIAWAYAGTADSAWSLTVLKQAAPGQETAFTLFWTDIVGLVTGDYDQDGDEDLAVARAQDRKLRIYSNNTSQGFPHTYSTSASEIYTDPRILPSDALPNASTPILADLGNQGLADFLIAVQSSNAEGGTSTTFEAFRAQPRGWLTAEEAFVQNSADPARQFLLDVSGDSIELTFWIRTKDYSASATHLEVLAWTQLDAQSQLVPTSDGPARHYPIAASQVMAPDPDWQVYGLSLPLEGGSPCSMPIRWLEVRLIAVVDDQIVRAGPTYTCAILVRLSDYAAIYNAEGQTNLAITVAPQLECGNLLASGSWPAAAVTRRRKAPPPPGVIPRIQIPAIPMGQIPD